MFAMVSIALKRCLQTMRSYRLYFLLAGVPYVLFLCFLHVQLQMYDQVKDRESHSSRDQMLHVVEHNKATDKIDSNGTFRFRDLMVEKLKPRLDDKQSDRTDGGRLESKRNNFIQTHERSKINRKVDKSERFDSHRIINHENAGLPKPRDTSCGKFQEIHNGDETANLNNFRHMGEGYIFSAFLDSRNSSTYFVRIIAMLRSNYQPQLFCHFWQGSLEFNNADGKLNSSAKDFHSEPASMYEMCENHNKEYGGWIVSCQVPSIYVKLNETPCEVVISKSYIYNQKSTDDVRVPIFATSPPHGDQKQQEGAFGICVPPLFGHIPSTTLVEFVELSRHLGADHVMFYIYKVTSAMEQVLEYYQDLNWVSIVQWEVPVRENQIWYHGQLLAINDCLYRSMSQFTHVVFHDIDEFLVPHRHTTWRDMTHYLGSFINVAGLTTTKTKTQSSTKHVKLKTTITAPATVITSDSELRCGYIFQSAFFDPLVNGNNKILYDLESDLRTKTFSKVRTKMLVRPQMVFELGIHHISRPFSPDFTYLEVDPSVAFIHHYRKCITDFDSEMKCHVFTRDESLYSYIPALRHSVHKTLWELKDLDKVTNQQQPQTPLVVAV